MSNTASRWSWMTWKPAEVVGRSDRYHAVVGVCDFYPSPYSLIILENHLMCLASNPECVTAPRALVVETMFSAGRKPLEATGIHAGTACPTGEDHVGQQAPLMPPAICPRIHMTRQWRVVEFGQRRTDAY